MGGVVIEGCGETGMAYRIGERRQLQLLPPSIEEYISADDPVRVYDAFVEQLSLGELGIEWDDGQVGPPEYEPRAMLKLLVYGYSYGIRSSRKLERATYHNLSFIWLLGGLKPDHKTIAEFRRRNRQSLARVLKQCARLCLRLGLIGGNTLFVDGSKLRGNASLDQQWSEDRCRRHLEQIDGRIEEILAESERTDVEESEEGSLVRMGEELMSEGKLKRKVAGILEQLRESESGTINSTDPDSVRIRDRHGSYVGYNLQMAVDEKEGLIVHSDVVNQNNDFGQLTEQVQRAQETLSRRSETVCADAGYCQYEDLEKLDRQGLKVIVPSKSQAGESSSKPFAKSAFRYEREADVYRCPAGQLLSYRRLAGRNKREYRTGKGVCRQCCYFSECTGDRKNGRLLVRYVNEEFRERLAATFEQPDSQMIYGRRKQKVELPFGHIKRNLGADYFLLRRLVGVRAEASLLATCFNIRRLITLIGVPLLIQKLAH
jgi:transposase